jgi:dihydroorotate dehydrogenase (fumarate)/dihydroorotate dehydrogenase
MGIYSTIVRPWTFRLDPENAHIIAIRAGARLAHVAGLIRPFLNVSDPRLVTDIAGIRFPSPVGLAAGFDKSGEAIQTLAALGFGSVEIGSVSIDPSGGNPYPRLFRLPEDRAIVVHYGLPNTGARAVAARIGGIKLPVPLGINIVKTNRGMGAGPETADQIIAEYVDAARLLAPHADYLMLNLSCPNTEDGRDFFADRAHLDACLSAFANVTWTLPIFLKISPLGGVATIERVLAAADPHHFINGFMFNLPPGKPAGLRTPEAVWRNMPGAVSGPPAAPLLDECLRECYRRMDRRRYVLFASGGVSTAADAYAKIRAGASMVQLLTALIYEGPGVVRDITRGLVRLIERDGLKSIADAVGADSR